MLDSKPARQGDPAQCALHGRTMIAMVDPARPMARMGDKALCGCDLGFAEIPGLLVDGIAAVELIGEYVVEGGSKWELVGARVDFTSQSHRRNNH